MADYQKLLAGSLEFSGTITRRIEKVIGGILTSLGDLLRQPAPKNVLQGDVSISHALVATATLSDSAIYGLTTSLEALPYGVSISDSIL